MSWRGDLVARLRGDAGLSAQTGERIAFFEGARSWGQTYPQLVLQEISVRRDWTHDGPDGLDQVRVQFDIYATGGAACEAVEAPLLAAMELAGTQGNTKFHEGFLEDRSMEVEDLGNQRRVHRLRMDFSFFYETV